MKLLTFTAHSAAEASNQLRAWFGPNAVLLAMKELPAPASSGNSMRPRVEVLAGLSGQPAPAEGRSKEETIKNLLRTIAQLHGELAPVAKPAAETSAACDWSAFAPLSAVGALRSSRTSTAEWRVRGVLEAFGLLGAYAQRVEDELRAVHGETPPDLLDDQMALAATMLSCWWRPPVRPGLEKSSPIHIFIGAPGVGKTTCLSKWLAQWVLLEARSPRVWRLDGRTANAAEALSVYAEILGVPVHRSWAGPALPKADAHFVDLPGVDWRDADAIQELGLRLGAWGQPQVHLVLNAAYELEVLLAQAEALSVLTVSDLIFTHLDEERRWGKVWNFVLGTNHAIGFFSAGQNVPGDFFAATPERFLPANSSAIPPIPAAAARR